MTFQKSRLALIALAIFALSACSASTGADKAPSGSGGSIDVAVSDTCAEGSDSQCVLVNGENVLLPATFEKAGVKDFSVIEGGQSAVDVTFTEDGAKVWQELTKEAVGAGDSARLLIKVGDKVQSAVRVMEPITGDQVQIALAPDESAQDLVDLIQGN